MNFKKDIKTEETGKTNFSDVYNSLSENHNNKWGKELLALIRDLNEVADEKSVKKHHCLFHLQ